MRVLIVKTSSMGDIVHAMPAISDMAQSVPGIHIDWLVERSFAALPSQHRAVDHVIPLQWRKWRKDLLRTETRQALRSWYRDMNRSKYDLIIDMQGLIKSAAFACFAQGPRGGYDWHSIREPLASLLYHRKTSVSRQLHAVDRCRRLAAQLLNYPLPSSPPDFGLITTPDYWRPSASPFAVLIPCASRPEKLWPLANWVAAGLRLKQLGWHVAIMWGSPEEQRLAQSIANQCDGIVPPFLTVQQVADTLARAELVIGLDTGMSHLAAAHGRPTIGIYCDHEPGLAGLRGAGPVSSLGGKGLIPSLESVQDTIDRMLQQREARPA